MDLRTRARALRSDGLTIKDVASAVGVPAGTVYGWVRDIPGPPRELWRPPVRRTKGALHERKLAEIAECDAWARERVASLSADAFFAAGIALYVGEGSKRDGTVAFANTNAETVRFFCNWLRRHFVVDESRMRVRVYLHADLDLEAAHEFWSSVTAVPVTQFRSSYRAVVDPTLRHNRHERGCVYVRYSCARTHRQIMGLCRALLASAPADPA
ncbi:MAG TPA: hypothetical protein VNA12_09865 [Mycobacteriales bacterium]|nr:hypothetical protein [Mycobacteriales bacterium]